MGKRCCMTSRAGSLEDFCTQHALRLFVIVWLSTPFDVCGHGAGKLDVRAAWLRFARTFVAVLFASSEENLELLRPTN